MAEMTIKDPGQGKKPPRVTFPGLLDLPWREGEFGEKSLVCLNLWFSDEIAWASTQAPSPISHCFRALHAQPGGFTPVTGSAAGRALLPDPEFL